MDAEIREAAERLSRHNAATNLSLSPYFFADDRYAPGLLDHRQMALDRMTLSDAYLASHPADGPSDTELLDALESPMKCYCVTVQSQPSGEIVYTGQGPFLRAAIRQAMGGGE